MKQSFIWLFISVCYLFSEDGTVLTINDNKFSIYKFLARYPKKQWDRADSLQKEKMFSEFVDRQLCILEAEKIGFYNDPAVSIKIRDRSLQILVNESYEQFVAKPLIPKSELDAARKHAKKELLANHILVGHSGSNITNPPSRTIDEAFVLSQKIKDEFDGGKSFSVLANKYSDDPSVENNSGSLGWLGWGATVSRFQDAAFNLETGIVSFPVLTDFGYHLILINDIRESDARFLRNGAYENHIINLSKNSIRDLLRPAALKYDSLKLLEFGVIFNMDAVGVVLDSYRRIQKESSVSGSRKTDSVTLLNSLSGSSVLCVFDGRGFGPKWFALRLNRIPSSRRPSFGSKNEILSALRTLVLQEIAVIEGRYSGVDSSFAFLQRKDDIVSGILYDAYLNHLIDTAEKPDSLDVKHYYEKHKNIKFRDEDKLLIREIRVPNKSLSDSILSIIESGGDFSFLAQRFSSINPEGGGVFGPFVRNQNPSLYDAASLLEKEGISGVIKTSGGSFSIIQLVEKHTPSFVPFNRAFIQIESILIKENQNLAKQMVVERLQTKYLITKNYSPLN